jgi:hypothetical protein
MQGFLTELPSKIEESPPGVTSENIHWRVFCREHFLATLRSRNFANARCPKTLVLNRCTGAGVGLVPSRLVMMERRGKKFKGRVDDGLGDMLVLSLRDFAL